MDSSFARRTRSRQPWSSALVGVAIAASNSDEGREATPAGAPRAHSSVPADFVPATIAARQNLGRYFVTMSGDSVVSAMRGGATSGAAQEATASAARASQESAIAEAQAAGGKVVFRYDTLVNGFSAAMSPRGRLRARRRAPTSPRSSPSRSCSKTNETQRSVHRRDQGLEEAQGQGPGHRRRRRRHRHRLHAQELRRARHVARLQGQQPERDRAGLVPDQEGDRRLRLRRPQLRGHRRGHRPTTSRAPIPTRSTTASSGDHGSHTSGTCCGKGVKGEIGPGVAPKSKLLAIKVWDEGDSTDDVLVAGFERAMDPNDDGNIKDAADVLTFSGGVDYGSAELGRGAGGAAGRRPRHRLRRRRRQRRQPAGRRLRLHRRARPRTRPA